jgi:hypothetical protein
MRVVLVLVWPSALAMTARSILVSYATLAHVWRMTYEVKPRFSPASFSSLWRVLGEYHCLQTFDVVAGGRSLHGLGVTGEQVFKRLAVFQVVLLYHLIIYSTQGTQVA